jgi:large subunit ribosomal protein L10
MQKEDKQRVVSDLTERLKNAQSLIVADYRGLTMPQIDNLRGELLKHGARFQVVKNTLTRRAAEEAGAEALLALLEGPSAIAFLEADGDPAAVAKAISAAARETRVLEVRGGVLEGRPITADDIENLAKLPPLDQLRGQVLGAITAPLYAIVGLFTAPLQNLVGLIDARIEQLEAQGDTSGSEPQTPAPGAEAAPEGEAVAEPVTSGSEPQGDAPSPEDPQTPRADATESVAAENQENTETAEEAPASDAGEEES